MPTSEPTDTDTSAANLAGHLGWLHWLALALSAGVTLLGYGVTKHQIETRVATAFEREAQRVVDLTIERMRKYEDALWAGVSAIDALGGDATHAEWRSFASSMRLQEKYPGINGIGVIHYVRPSGLPAYLARQRRGRPDYRMHPAHALDEYWPISYIEPVASNRAAVGLDMAHEQNRRTAARRARDTGLAQVTGPIVLVQDAHKTPGFLFYAPFFARGPGASSEAAAPAEGAGERFGGLVYAPFVVHRLMQGTLDRRGRHVGVAIRDGGELLYDEHRPEDPDFDPDPQYTRHFDLPFYGRSWHFDVRSDRTFRQESASAQPLTILVGGAVIDLLLLTLFLGLGRSREQAVRYARRATAEVRAQQAALEERNEALHQQSRELDAARLDAERARDAAQAAAGAKADFLATMSHELRTPMNGVIATADLLRDATAADERLELTETIITSGRTLLALVNDILDFSKLEAGKLTLDPLPTSPAEALAEIESLLLPQCKEKRLDLHIHVDPAVPAWVEVDPLRLGQVLLNLASNAVKFTPRGEVTLACRFLPDADGAATGQCLFEVRDTGIGIADHQHLFTEFTQADASTTRRFGGTGLGLAICKRLVAAMDGEIGVDSAQGVGSRFWFKLRLPVAAAPVGKPGGAAGGELSAATTPGRALIVDDNRINRMVAQKILVRMGWQTQLAEDGEQAVRAAAATDFDLILMDCQMPGMDGFEATRQIRAHRADCPPIIALTANALPEDRARCLQAGMSDYLAKPVVAAALEQVIRRWGPGRPVADDRSEAGGS